jgi:histidinol-phosphate/aromatic aminotransferase/cobyric acid decarboxylase-like protein
MTTAGPTLHRRRHDGRVNLSSNELLHPGLAPLLRAGLAAFDATGLGSYPDFDAGARALAPLLGLDEDAMLLVPGTDAAIRAVVRLLVASAPRPPALLLQYPNYYAWEQAAVNARCRLVPVGWNGPAEQGATILAAARAHRNAIVAISFPNGPIGGGMTLDDVDLLAEVCAERGHWLLLDLCYAAFDRQLPSLNGRWGPHVLAIQSLSKTFGLAGLRIGFVTGDRAVIARLADERIEHCVSTPALAVARHMAGQRPALEAIWDDIACERAALGCALAELGFAPIPSGGNFVTFGAGTPMAAARLAEAMSARGYRIKHFDAIAGFTDCLRMTVAHAGLAAPALAALEEASRELSRRAAGE